MPEVLTAKTYATRLLQAPVELPWPEEHPALGWARSGLMSLTGSTPTMCVAALTTCADGALAALAHLAKVDFKLRGRDLLADRAAAFGHPTGSCRILEGADARFALNLAREDDWNLLPAWLEEDTSPDWGAITKIVRQHKASNLIARARELGLAAAPAEETHVAKHWVTRSHNSSAAPATRAPLVVDLSTLWAGPLCGQLLRHCGARVIKAESTQRPDGARNSPGAFFELMNKGKESATFDLSSAQGREQLRSLIAQADIVIESARPRALRQMGLHAEEFLKQKPGQAWIAISAYGRSEPEENWIGYGDDCAIAAGLSAQMHKATGEWLVVGDAIADPLTGLHAALCAWNAWTKGEGGLYALALRDVVSHCIAADAPQNPRARHEEWTRITNEHGGAQAPRLRNII